jgi:hypothetical protein
MKDGTIFWLRRDFSGQDIWSQAMVGKENIGKFIKTHPRRKGYLGIQRRSS